MTTPAAAPDLSRAYGQWLTRDIIAWPCEQLPPGLDPAELDWCLHWSRNGGIDLWAPEPVEWNTVPLRIIPSGLPAELAARYPRLRQSIALRVPPGLDAPEVLMGQVAVVVQKPSGRLVNASGLQTAGVLDQVYADARRAKLGPSFADGVPTLRVWAPTAHEVGLLLWRPDAPLDEAPQTVAMVRESDGCWAATGDPSWRGCRYLYLVTVFAPSFQRMVTNRVTDPYSLGLAVNSSHSLVVDLDDPRLAPQAWTDAPQPRLDHPVQQTIYELHVRDFSRADQTLPPEIRGTYLAFAADGLGARHLRQLAAAGLNTVQLLPVFDSTSVEENRARQWAQDTKKLRSMAPDSDEQQNYLREAGQRRAFNWGYDPWHYMVPEGSYATPEGVGNGVRIQQCRTMIGALHEMGLRVVLDQVYNHTSGEGQAANSVLGRLVPGYYHRRDVCGQVHRSTCCPNVATEHMMAEKLMVDSCVLWASQYKVDGFRFDLMGHHTRHNMIAVRAALDALTPERDGVDGRQVTMYGEGWSFGEVADNALFVQASQGQLGGTHIGTFSDRLRDAVRGGVPFDQDPRLQGFGTGLFTEPNACTGNGARHEQLRELLHDADLIQLGMAGNLRTFGFISQEHARPLRGDQILYREVAAGYADEPDEVVNYVDAHDNETLFDALTLKLPIRTPMADRIRANTLCLAFPALGQSAVMWHAGADFLRSKSLDRNSYDSGDWFNYLDFSMADNGFGAGLPPASDNAPRWEFMRPLLAMRELKPSPEEMWRAHAAALDLLRIRTSSRLFTLGSAAQIEAKVSFPVSGTWAQTPGVIVMLLDDTQKEQVDVRWRRIVVVFNATGWPVRQQVESLRAGAWELHPIQLEGADALVRASRADDGLFTVPGRTVAVFVEPR